MKASFILGYFLFVALLSFGQLQSKKVDILWGPEQKESKWSTLSDVLGYDSTGIYALKKQKSGLYGYGFVSSITLEHYNHKMIKTKSVEIELEGKKEFRFIIHENNEMYLFSSFHNRKLKSNMLYAQSINKKTLQLNHDVKKYQKLIIPEKAKAIREIIRTKYPGIHRRY